MPVRVRPRSNQDIKGLCVDIRGYGVVVNISACRAEDGSSILPILAICLSRNHINPAMGYSLLT